MGVALGSNLNVYKTVLAKLIQHMIEKANGCVDAPGTAAVQVYGHRNFCLMRFALNTGTAGGWGGHCRRVYYKKINRSMT
jgi:hypothetical protein